MNAVREAIEGVLVAFPEGESTLKERAGLVYTLVHAVEAVPVQVTIRELDMTDSENIVTVWSPIDIDYFLGFVQEARRAGSMSITVDGGYLKIKAGDYGTWSAPIATKIYR